MNPIPVNKPLFAGNEMAYVTDCVQTGWVSSEGAYIHQFENRFSAYVNRKFGVAVTNGSAALDVAVQALGLEKGDEVIMPAFTIISPAFSIIRAGAKPVLVDADPVTWNIDANLIQKKVTPQTKAILIVHIYGLAVDMDPVLKLAERYGLYIIEDAAEAHAQTYKGQKCGSFGDISIFSFYPNKLITTGEGGMIVTNNESIAERCRKLRNLAFEPAGRRFVHNEMGWNYRMTNLQAALGLAQLEQIEEHLAIKKKMGSYYQAGLRNLTGFQLPVQSLPYTENAYWVFGLVADSAGLAQNIINYLTQKKIGTRPFFWSMHEQPVFRKMGLFEQEHYPIAERLSRQGFYIPSGLGLVQAEQDEVIHALLTANG